MRTPEDALEMRRLHGLGWGTRRIAVHPGVAEFDLEGRPATVAGIHDGIHLQTLFLAVVEDRRVSRSGRGGR